MTKHLNNSNLIKDVIIGMSDGLTVPFALTAGLSLILSSTKIITMSGLAEIVAGSVSMGLGGFLSSRAQYDYFNAMLENEYAEIDSVPDEERDEVKKIFTDLGVSDDLGDKVTEEITRDRGNWTNLMMRMELGLERPDKKSSARSGLTIASAYAVGGMIPLLPYMACDTVTAAFWWSCALTLAVLTVFGYFKSVFTKQNVVTGTLQTVMLSAIAVIAVYVITRFI